jgi:hypothetical protein
VWQEDYYEKVVEWYLCPQLNHHKPVLLGIMGRGQPIYTASLQAQPYHGEVLTRFLSLPIKSLIYLFNLWIERGLTNLGNYGVTTNLIRLQNGVI